MGPQHGKSTVSIHVNSYLIPWLQLDTASTPTAIMDSCSETPDYCNQLVVQRNRLPARSYWIPEESVLLNGTWDFQLAPTPLHTVDDWRSIEVPGHWQLQGHGRPHYTNVPYPFPIDPPFVPTENPVGTYETGNSVSRPAGEFRHKFG